MQNLKLIFPGILRIFDLECHGQASLKVVFVKFTYVFKVFSKLESLHVESKKLVRHKTEAAQEMFCKKKCLKKFRKIHRKTPVPESLF